MLSQSELVGVTTITAHVGIIMSSKVAKRNAEIAGGEKVAKQRPLRRRIRDTVRLLSRVRTMFGKWRPLALLISN